MVLLENILQEPLWFLVWCAWLGVVNMAAVLFLRHKPARWVLAALICNLVFMSTLAEINGYNGLLGISHVIFWTPLLVYLYRLRATVERASWVTHWFVALFVSNAVSLVMDSVEVVRYFTGDGALT